MPVYPEAHLGGEPETHQGALRGCCPIPAQPFQRETHSLFAILASVTGFAGGAAIAAALQALTRPRESAKKKEVPS